MATAFVSHASPDKDVAEKIVAHLEDRGIACWIAPRDVRPGHEYAAEIMRGISECPVMLLVLSEHANDSLFVKREIERGVSQGKPVFPIRVREVLPSQSLELFISSHHWIDAFKPPLEQYLGRLVEAIQAVVGSDAGTGAATRPPAPPGSNGAHTGSGSAGKYWVAGGAVVVLGALAFGVLQFAPGVLDRSEQAPPLTAESFGEPGANSGPEKDPAPSESPVATAEQTNAQGDAEDEAPAPVLQPEASVRTGPAAEGLPFDQVMVAVKGEAGGQRYRTIKLLADDMVPELTADQVLAIVGPSAYRLNAIELLKTRLPETLSYEDIMKFVDPVGGGERYNTIKAFAGRMPESLVADQALAIVESSAYRLNAVELLKERLAETLSYEDIMKFVDPVAGGERYNTIKAFAARLPENLTTDQALSIVESSAYRLNAIALLKECLPDPLTYEDVMKLVGPVEGGERYNTIKTFADRMAGDLSMEQIEAIIATSSYLGNARALLINRRDRS